MNNAALGILAEDRDVILYRPKFRQITDSVTAAILLQQIFYRWYHNGKKPFYKYKEPCDAADYRPGDSWCEELGYSRTEFDNAIAKLGQKVSASVKKDTAILVWYWITPERKTWYEVNEVALRNAVNLIYGTQETDVTKVNFPAIDSITENTTEKTAKSSANKRALKSTAQPHPETQAILTAYVEARGKNGINYQKEGTFAKKIAKDGYNPTQVKGCYLWLKADTFWEDKPVTLDIIFKHMPEYMTWAERQGIDTTTGSSGEATVIDVDWRVS